MRLGRILKYCHDYVRIINERDYVPFIEDETVLYEGFLCGVPSSLKKRALYGIYPTYQKDGLGDALLIVLK